MSVLDELCICGIRSFGPNDEEKLTFSTPLTLFLGQNGCGKTTIIECLKYALTSDLPAGTGANVFVNDPNLSKKRSTKGYINLKFRDGKGNCVNVNKTVKVSLLGEGKLSRLSFKKLSQTIRWEDEKGNVQDIAERCDEFCIQKLNVPKAIINNVIFCHQENSAWPLEEPNKLKKNFDKIFGSTAYNECVERLRKYAKEKRDHINVLYEQLVRMEMAKGHTEKLRNALKKKETRWEDIQRTIEGKRREIEPLENRLNEINALVESSSAMRETLTGLEEKLKGILEQQESLKKHLLEEYEGTAEDLDNEILNFNKFQDVAMKEILEKESTKQNIYAKIEGTNGAIQKGQISFGQLEEEQSQHSKRCQELKSLIEKAKTEFVVPTESDEPLADILCKLNTAFKDDDIKFSDYRKNTEENENELQADIDRIRIKHAAAQGRHFSNSKQIDETKTKLQGTKSKLSVLSCCNNRRESIEKLITEAEENLARKRAEFVEDNEARHLEELDRIINQKECTQIELERDCQVLQENDKTQQRIDSEKDLLIERKREISNLKNKHEHDFKILFGEDLPQDKFEELILNIQQREEKNVKNIVQDISTRQKKVASLEYAVKLTTELLQRCNNELSIDMNKVESACGGIKAFSDILAQSYSKKEKLQKEKEASLSAKILFEQFISQFQQKSPCCPVCATDFSSKKSEVSNIINMLRRKIEDLPQKLAEIETQLKKEEELYNKLQQLEPIRESIRISEERRLPILKKQLHQNEEEFNEANIKFSFLKKGLSEPQDLIKTCSKTIVDAALLDRYNREVKQGEDLLESLQQCLVTVPSNRTLDETKTELSKLKAELTNLRRQCKDERDLFNDAKDTIQKLNGQLQLEINEKLKVEKLLQAQQLFERQIAEYKETIAQLEDNQEGLSEEIVTAQRDLEEAEKNRNNEVANNKKEIHKYRLRMDVRKRLIDDVEKLHDIVQAYERGDSKIKLETVLKELAECKTNLRELEHTKEVLMDAIEKKKGELASQEIKLRSLKDNKDLRSCRVKSQDLEKQIRDIKKQIGHDNSGSIRQERSKVIDEIASIHSEINRKIGEQDMVKESIQEDQLELNKNEHKEALVLYKKKFYEWKVEQLAVDDLEVYTRALEESILKFHEERMVQINMTIRELWRNIYKGNDIDYIEIQAVDKIRSGASGKRSYDYKVVQWNRGVQMEMRGRCSAGQKVLACLVIRLALAETLSANCGIFALDEPTTNLDRDNIMSLSDALSRIIAARETQKNFQLLIITHDEEFLQTLTRDQRVSHYFRVQRNVDGFSEIRKEILYV